MRHANLIDPDGDRLLLHGTPKVLFVTVAGEDGILTAGGFTRAQIEELLDAVAPAGSYTRTDEKDWQAHAERAERALAEMTVHRDQCRDTAIKWQMEANRAVQPRALAPDAITDEMVERARRFNEHLSPETIREALTAALTEPTRPEGAEELDDHIAGMDINLMPETVYAYADFLAERGVRVVTEERS